MTIPVWFLPTITALFMWGLTTFLPKLAVRTLPPLHLAVYSSFFSLATVIVVMAFYGFQIDFQWQGVWLSVLIGILGKAGFLMFLFAIRSNSMTPATVVTSLYPVVAVALSFFILHERLTERQMAGVALGICSIVLMVVARDDRLKK